MSSYQLEFFCPQDIHVVSSCFDGDHDIAAFRSSRVAAEYAHGLWREYWDDQDVDPVEYKTYLDDGAVNECKFWPRGELPMRAWCDAGDYYEISAYSVELR